MNSYSAFNMHNLANKVREHNLFTEQTAETVLDPVFELNKVEEKYKKFVPAIYKAVGCILNHLEPMRFKAVCGDLLGNVETALRLPLEKDEWGKVQHHSVIDGAGFVKHWEVNDKGELTYAGWVDPEDLVNHQFGSNDTDDIKLDAAIDAANQSHLFQQLKLELRVLPGYKLVASTIQGEQK